MSGSRGSGAGNAGGSQPIPAGSRKMVQSLKEIVNCSEAEIYAALKDCNMDPNEAVNRLLSQDPFHEVKSKREKKKEGKDTTESRSRSTNNNSTRNNKIGADRYGGRGGSTSNSYGETLPLPGKSAYKKDNGSIPHASSSFPTLGTSGSSRSRGASTGYSNAAFSENKGSLSGTNDAMSSGGINPGSGYQAAWASGPSMADIVKMGRPNYRVPNDNVLAPSTDFSQHNLRLPEDHASKDPVSGISSVHKVPATEEWPIIEKPASTEVVSIPECPVHSEKDLELSRVPSDAINLHSDIEEEEDMEDENIETSATNDMESDFIYNRKIPEGDSRGASLFENDLYSYKNQAHESYADEDISASVLSVTRNLQQLSVEKDDRDSPSAGCQPSVVIPDHLQVQVADCSHLSFGSFGSGMNVAYSSGTVASIPVKSNLEEVNAEADVASVVPVDNRTSEYPVDDSVRNASDGGLFHSVGASAGSYETPSVSHGVELKADSVDVAHRNQYPFPSLNPSYAFDDAQHLNASLSQMSSPLQNLSPFSAVSYTTNSLPTNVHPDRESDIHYSPFPGSLSKYGNSSLGGSAISMSEAASLPLPTTHTLSGTGPPLPQHLAVHPYSQPSLPLGPFTNVLSYPFLPQSYAYMPSSYHQSLATVLPQYKSSVSAPQSGGFGNTTTIGGNFPSTSLNYDDVLTSHYKDGRHQQQVENSAATWLQGPNSRTMSASSFYNYQGQNQQSVGFRQGQQQQQLSQNYRALGGYPNIYLSQSDLHQNPRDGPLGSSQGQPKSSQIWQNSY